MTDSPTNSLPEALWWHCHHDLEKNERINALCQQGLAHGYRVAVLATPEQLISNLTVQENIALPHDWHHVDTTIAHPLAIEAVHQCLQHCVRGQQTLEQLLQLQGARLSINQRRWVGIARALYLQANWLVMDDDETNLYPFEDVRLKTLSQHLPDATMHWVSLRAPATLPDHWLFAESGVDN